MKKPNIKTKVVHSQTKSAWNVVATTLGGKYKIARVPYAVAADEEIDNRNRMEAFEHAEFISYCFNNPNACGLPSKEKAVQVGFIKATDEGYSLRKVCRDIDNDNYYSGWLDCFDWVSKQS